MHKQAKVKIRGTRPLQFHAFGIHALDGGRKEKTGTAGNDPSEWRKTVLAMPDGQLYITRPYIFGCLKNGGKHEKVGKGSLLPKVAATLQVCGSDKIPIIGRKLPGSIDSIKNEDLSTNPEDPVYLNIAGVRNPSTKARNIRYTICCCTGWELEFHIMWDVTMISENSMEAICISAGSFEGLGDGRSIGNGRFEILSFELEKVDAKKKATK